MAKQIRVGNAVVAVKSGGPFWSVGAKGMVRLFCEDGVLVVVEFQLGEFDAGDRCLSARENDYPNGTWAVLPGDIELLTD